MDRRGGVPTAMRGGAAGLGASRCLAPRVKKPIFGKENLRRGLLTESARFFSGVAAPDARPAGRGDVADADFFRPGDSSPSAPEDPRPLGDGIGDPNAFSSSVRGAKVACRARILAWDIGLGGSAWGGTLFASPRRSTLMAATGDSTILAVLGRGVGPLSTPRGTGRAQTRS